jgi:hypothetical protein
MGILKLHSFLESDIVETIFDQDKGDWEHKDYRVGLERGGEELPLSPRYMKSLAPFTKMRYFQHEYRTHPVG